MNTEAATTATPDTTDNPEPFQELPDVYQGGVRIPHSYVYYEKLEAARRAANPQPEKVEEPAHTPDEFDEEEVFEFEQPEGPEGRPGVSPLDCKTTRTHTVSKPIQLARESPRCIHIKPSGLRCGSPAMRGVDYCYYHKRTHLGPRLLYPTLMMLEDAHGIQAALMEVLCAILEGGLQPKIAGLLLYGLQTAACNLKRVVDVDPAEVTTEEPEHDRLQDGIFKPDPCSGYAMNIGPGSTARGAAEERQKWSDANGGPPVAAPGLVTEPFVSEADLQDHAGEVARATRTDPIPAIPRFPDSGDCPTVRPPSPEPRVCRPG
jgi:hypothetical protein